MVSLKSKSSLISKINFWNGVPFYFLVILLFVVIRLEPSALSYNGFNLLLSAAVPLAFAATSFDRRNPWCFLRLARNCHHDSAKPGRRGPYLHN